jgi:hypothetical protein
VTSEIVVTAPVRLCCGQRHLGAVCPDGMVMCCVCFYRFSPAGLYVDAQKDRWDVCLGCAPSTVRQETPNRRKQS